jgi:hypothetical protein
MVAYHFDGLEEVETFALGTSTFLIHHDNVAIEAARTIYSSCISDGGTQARKRAQREE